MNYLLLAPIDTTKLIIVIAVVAVLSIVFALLIVLVSRLCAVKEDERANQIAENLAGANCGGCGFAGCADFAKALSEGRADISGCGPTPNENKAIIAKILGVEFKETEQAYAVVKCMGGQNCSDTYSYVGNEGCVARSTFMGGTKACSFGCLGAGTCQAVCPYHALVVKNGVATVDKALCEACGVCAKKCPKHIIELIPKSSKVFVACSSNCRGKDVMNACKAGCIGCGLCVKNCPSGAITMVNNLPVIDYSKCTGCRVCASKCPRKCIKEI